MKKSSAESRLRLSLPELDRRPLIVALAGPNGAGKSTFYEAHLQQCGLRFLNADVLARELKMEAYPAAEITSALRREFVQQRESFVFETVLSDPVADKVTFLEQVSQQGYNVVMCFIGIADAGRSKERVSMRVSQGGHDVPTDKLVTRFPRTIHNLYQAIRRLPCVAIFDNDDLGLPYRLVAIFKAGKEVFGQKPIPAWLRISG